jgi:hypothetical protein
MTGPGVIAAVLAELARIDQPRNSSDTGLLLATAVAHLTLLALLVVAVRKARKGDYLGLSCVLGAFVLSWGEAVYDQPFHLTFYTGDLTLWSPFGINQPIWVPAGYAMAYGMGGWWVAQTLLRGNASRRDVARMLAVVWLGCFGFETFAGHVGAFEYYDHPITVFGTPPWIETLNAVFIVVAGILIAVAQPVLRTVPARLLVATLAYLVGFTGVTYGAGFLPLDVMNSPHAGGVWMWLAVLASQVIALAILVVVVDLVGLLPAYRDGFARGPRLLKIAQPDRRSV